MHVQVHSMLLHFFRRNQQEEGGLIYFLFNKLTCIVGALGAKWLVFKSLKEHVLKSTLMMIGQKMKSTRNLSISELEV